MGEILLANRFKVLSELGRGGMGAVFRVADTLGANQEYALKSIQVEGKITEDLKLRFKEEFRAMIKLKHPNTIEVFDYGQLDDQTQYLTMEIVPGRELTEMVRDKRMALAEFYPLLVQLLQALGFIHSRLYVHRDIKSDNIRVRTDGTLKLMDFGLMDQLGNPSSGKITGTPGYLPPEVPKGGVIDASSDLYSVGCLAYEMLVGHLPFGGNVVEVIRAHMNQEPVPVGQLRPEIPDGLDALVSRLLHKDQKLRYQSAADVIADLADISGLKIARENSAQKKSYLTSSVLVGRDRELDQLQAALTAVQGGVGRSVFVGAPAGIGKSRLVQELLLQAKLADLPVLHGQCLESGMSAYEPLVSALRPVLALSTADELATYGSVLVKLFPDLAAQGIEPAAPLPSVAEKIRTNETVVEWLRSVSGRTPLVLFFDDLHWIDQASLETFNHCVRQMKGDAVMCLATFRNDEAPPSSPIWFTIDENLTQYMKLNAFNLAQSMLLLQAMLRDVTIGREFTEFLYNSTSGNAFFLTEVMRYLLEEDVLAFKEGSWHFPTDTASLVLPTSVEATVNRRLAQLSDEARALAHVAAVLGRYQERDMLLFVAQVDEDALFARLDELVERQFLVKDDNRYTFPHDRVREALYEGMDADDRRTYHQRSGEFIERAHAGGTSAITNELAHHFKNGRDMAKAYAYLRTAGNEAKVGGQSALALELWRDAERILTDLDMPDKEVEQVGLWFTIGSFGFEIWPAFGVEVLEKLIPVLEAQGNVDAVSALLTKVVGLIRKLPPATSRKIIGKLMEPVPYHHKVRKGLAKLVPPPPPAWVPQVIQSYVFLSAAYGFSGQPEKGEKMMDRAEALLPFTGTPLHGVMLAARGVSLTPAGLFDKMRQYAERSKPLIFGDFDINALEVTAVAPIAYADYHNGVCFQGIRPDDDVLELGLQCAEKVQIHSFKNVTWARHALWFAWTGRYEEANDYLELMTQNSRKVGAPPYHWSIYLRPYLAWQRGEFDEAKALMQTAMRYPHLDRDFGAEQAIRILKGTIHLANDELDAADEEFKGCEARARKGKLGLILNWALSGQGEVAMARGNFEAAQTFFEEALKRAASGPTRNPLREGIVLRLLATLALKRGEHEKARQQLEASLAIWLRPEQDNLLEAGNVRRLLGELALAEGDGELAREQLRAAGEIFHGLKNRFLLRPVARQLEAMRKPNSTAAREFVVPDDRPETRLSVLSSQWNEQFVLHVSAIADGDRMVQTALATCLASLEGEEASFYRLDGQANWAASRNAAGDECPEFRNNRSYIDQVCADGEGICAIDLPTEMAIGVSSNLEMEIPSVMVAPVRHAGRLLGVLYLTKRDISRPFEEEDLAILTSFGEVFGRAIGSRPAAGVAPSQGALRTVVADELRLSMSSMSFDLESQADLWPRLLQETVRKLNVDGLVVLVQHEEGGGYSTLGTGGSDSVLNLEFVGRVAQSQQSLCAIDMPANFGEASTTETEIASVAITPLGNQPTTYLYCVRRNLETPLQDEDLPAIEACAVVLAESLASLSAI